MSPRAVTLRNIPTITTLLEKKSPKIGNITWSMSHRGKTHQAPTPAGISAPCPSEPPLTRYLEGDVNRVLTAA